MIPFCVKCNKYISINNGFCPFCGNALEMTQGNLTFEFIMLNNVTVTNKNTGKKKYKYVVKQSKSGFTHSIKLNRPVLRITEIDRRNNRYFEEIFDDQRNETIHLCDEPLDKHIGHGSAKFKKK